MAEQEQAAATSTKKPKRARRKRSKVRKFSATKTTVKVAARRGPGRPKGSKNRVVTKKRGRKGRTSYTPAKRAEILAAAKREGLTAVQVQKRFGVTPVTYYSWRKKTGASGRRGRPPGSTQRSSINGLGNQLRSEVQARIREVMPAIVRSEVDAYLRATLGGRGRGRPRGQ